MCFKQCFLFFSFFSGAVASKEEGGVLEQARGSLDPFGGYCIVKLDDERTRLSCVFDK